jgi:hypothetical protein
MVAVRLTVIIEEEKEVGPGSDQRQWSTQIVIEPHNTRTDGNTSQHLHTFLFHHAHAHTLYLI